MNIFVHDGHVKNVICVYVWTWNDLLEGSMLIYIAKSLSRATDFCLNACPLIHIDIYIYNFNFKIQCPNVI